MPRYGEDERVIVVDRGNGGRDIFDQFVADLVKKALDHKHKHEDEEDGKRRPRRWNKPVNKEVVACWTLLLMAASPWIGLKMLTMYASLLGQYAGILNQFVK